jgi:hypothetical protein
VNLKRIKTLVREDVSLRVPIDGRRSSSRHDGQGDLKESQQSEPEASSRVHSLVVFFFFFFFSVAGLVFICYPHKQS